MARPVLSPTGHPAPGFPLKLAATFLVAIGYCTLSWLDRGLFFDFHELGFRALAPVVFDFGSRSWITLICVVAALPILGWLGDRFGPSRVMLGCSLLALISTIHVYSTGGPNAITTAIRFVGYTGAAGILAFAVLVSRYRTDRILLTIAGVWAAGKPIGLFGGMVIWRFPADTLPGTHILAIGLAILLISAAAIFAVLDSRNRSGTRPMMEAESGNRPRLGRSFWVITAAVVFAVLQTKFAEVVIANSFAGRMVPIGATPAKSLGYGVSFVAIFIVGVFGMRFRLPRYAACVELIRTLFLLVFAFFAGSAAATYISTGFFFVLSDCAILLGIVLVSRHVATASQGFALCLMLSIVLIVQVALVAVSPHFPVMSILTATGWWLAVPILFGIASAALYSRLDEENSALSAQPTAKVFE